MKIITIVENTSENEQLQCEHGLCLFIETKEHHVLMDTGQTDLFSDNMKKLGIDPSSIDTAVLSHGHFDHGGGLLKFAEMCPDVPIYMRENVFGDFYAKDRYIGLDRRVRDIPSIRLVKGDLKIDDELFLFTNIRGRRAWPKGNRILTEHIGGEIRQDEFTHEQCLVVRSGGRSVLFSGCAHNGILNILDRYREIFGGEPDAVFSGFHMIKNKPYKEDEAETIKETAEELAKLRTVFYTGHCTGDAAFDIMKPVMGDKLRRMRTGTVTEIADDPDI
jgi:7,8-dihydropterin-6-yl-methyl-4-(beta-D-ribofuranosyl)aminobenzene 5'-phosphate synthase